LLDKKIEYLIKNKNGFNIFHLISKLNSINILKIVVNEIKKNIFGEFENLILAYIDCHGGQHSQTPLHIAAKSDSVEVADYLINELKVNREALDYKLRTPLLIAAEFSK
jgi:ankyrin repeat protein